MAKEVRIDGTDLDAHLDNGDFPESIMEKLEEILFNMKDNPGDVNETLTITIVNDFEPDEEEESEDEESEDETEGKEVK